MTPAGAKLATRGKSLRRRWPYDDRARSKITVDRVLMDLQDLQELLYLQMDPTKPHSATVVVNGRGWR